jgi:ATP-binding cassette, subfamily C (CFTR/MRP), member 1
MVVKSGKQLHSILLSTVLNAPMSFFSSTDTGTTTNRFSQDMELVDGQLPGALMNTVSILLLCIGYGALTAAASLWIALSFPGVIFIFYAVQKYYLRTSRQLRFMDLEAKSPLYTQFIESLGGLATIRAFGWENDSQVHNNELLDSSQQPFYLLFMIQRWLTLVLDLVAMGLALIVVGLAFKIRATVSAGRLQ